MSPRSERHDMTELLDWAESAEPFDWKENAELDAWNEPIEKADIAEPTEPTEANDPMEPIESTDPFEEIERTESCDHSDHKEPSVMPSVSQARLGASPDGVGPHDRLVDGVAAGVLPLQPQGRVSRRVVGHGDRAGSGLAAVGCPRMGAARDSRLGPGVAVIPRNLDARAGHGQ